MLAAYLMVLSRLAERTGITTDEPSHILSSILYWEGNDKLAPRDMPPLIKITGGWAAARAGFRIVEESHPVWKTNHEWNISQDMILRMSERSLRSSMYQARLPLLIFPVMTSLLLWWWGRQLFTPLTGLMLAFLFMAEPTALAHGALFKNDHASAFGYLLFWYCAWRYWKKSTLANATWLGVATAVAVLTKLSMLILAPIAPAIVLAVAMARARSVPRALAALLLVLVIPYATAIAACQFETQPLGFLPVPAPMRTGVQALLFNSAKETAVYLTGHRYPWGSRAYFAIGALVKSPEVLLVLLLTGIVFLARQFRQKALTLADAFWLLPGALYFSLASLSSLQLGFRLILPCLPFAILLCGAPLRLLEKHRWPLLLIATVLIAPLVVYYPNYLPYFNYVSGGAANGLRYLSDSNLDWGQGLRELRRYVNENRIEQFSLSYMGSDSVTAYLRPEFYHWIDPPFSGRPISTMLYTPPPGVYAISATLLTGQYFEEPYRDFYRAFRESKPIAYAGYSIYIYRFR
ncbi:MAG TPA: glycosyltransferase family 39 protein [Bryobacteraceae bacterium]|nr:glycosyltransferase family 39 protein [Bryobacteraceae bacterium]